MSWSVKAVGRIAAVRESLEKQFEQARAGAQHVPHEAASVGMIEGVVNGQLDFLAESTRPLAVRVEASGSAWSSAVTEQGIEHRNRSTQTKVLVELIDGFLG